MNNGRLALKKSLMFFLSSRQQIEIGCAAVEAQRPPLRAKRHRDVQVLSFFAK